MFGLCAKILFNFLEDFRAHLVWHGHGLHTYNTNLHLWGASCPLLNKLVSFCLTVRILRSSQPITVGVYMIEIPEDNACPRLIVVYALVVFQGGISHIAIYGSVRLLLQVDVTPYQQSLLT